MIKTEGLYLARSDLYQVLLFFFSYDTSIVKCHFYLMPDPSITGITFKKNQVSRLKNGITLKRNGITILKNRNHISKLSATNILRILSQKKGEIENSKNMEDPKNVSRYRLMK